jgi:hypothetical protein
MCGCACHQAGKSGCGFCGCSGWYLIIGVSGYLRSGKDSAGQALVADGFHHASFAAKLKDFLYAVNPWVEIQGSKSFRVRNVVDAHGWEYAKDQFPEVRALLQRVGTDAGRKVLGENVWVDAVMRDLPQRPVVFTDVRFPNEAKAIQDAGGAVVRITRPGFTPGPDAHVSETALDDFRFDYHVTNSGTLDDLHSAIRGIAAMERVER